MNEPQLCPACGAAVHPASRFCDQCGTRLAPLERRHETRKVVSVLFSDVAGSTSLGESLDPESLRLVMTRYFAAVAEVLEQHGGVVEKFIGDAVMAVFGVPVAHEEDAVRAVRAAVETKAALAALNDELEAGWGVRIHTRTGVNTGEVVAGDPEGGQLIVTGDAVNVAARLEQAAGPDEILIGRHTEHLVRDVALLEPVAPLELKGKVERVPAWRVLDLLPEKVRADVGFDLPLVGREFELDQLRQTFARTVSGSRCSLFTLLGAAGMGKSRVAAEFLLGVAESATIVRGRCLAYGQGITYWPLVDILEELVGAETRPGVERLLEGDPEAEQVAAVLATAVGKDAADAESADIFWAVRKVFEVTAARQPLVVVIDDLHRGEPTFLDLVDHLADWIRDVPVLLLCLSRRELISARPTWGGGKLSATTMLLEPLSRDACRALVTELAGDFALHSAEEAAMQERVIATAEGNPLFIAQLLAMADEQGTERALEVPPTIHALLAARLDGLPAELRDVVDRASVIGREFWVDALAELTPGAATDDVRTKLDALVRRQLVAPAASPGGRAAFRFRDPLVWETTYSGLAKGLRAELHEQFARWLETAVEQHPNELDEMIGYHLERAFVHRAELGHADEKARKLEAAAAERLAGAGRRALARDDLHAAATLLERAAALARTETSERVHLLFDLGDTLFDLGELARCRSVLADACEKAAFDPRLEAHAAIRSRLVEVRIDPTTAADTLAASAREIALLEQPPQDHLGLARTCELEAHVHFVRQNLAAAEDALVRALGHLQLAGAAREERRTITGLCELALWGPRHVDEALERCRAFAEELHSSRRLRALALLAISGLLAMRGELEEARAVGREARSLLEELGLSIAVAAATHVTGLVELLAGDGEAAERELRPGYEIFLDLDHSGGVAASAVLLAQALLLEGRSEDAEERVRETIDAAADGDVTAQIAWRTVQARIEATRGETAEAERLAREAVELAEAIDDLRGRGDATLTLATVLADAGRGDEARPLVRDAIELYERKGVRPGIEAARRLEERLAA